MHEKTPFRTWLGILILVAVGLAAYAQGLRSDFAFDEHLLITQNLSLRSLKNIPEFFGSKFWPGQAKGIYYRPVITTSYALNYRAGKTRPFIYHATNTAFHVFNCILVFFLLRRLEIRGAFLAALIFAVHPVHVESVTWISGRTDVIAVFFILCAWLAWLKLSERAATMKVKVRWGVISIFFYGLALLSKETAIVFPVLLLVFDLSDRDGKLRTGEVLKTRAALYLTLLAVSLAYITVRHLVLSGPGPEPAPAFFAGHTVWTRVQVMAMVWLKYLRLLFIPHPLRIDYFYSQAYPPDMVSGVTPLLAAVLITLITASAIINIRRRPIFSRLVLCAAVSLLPFSHLISIPTLMAERFLYLPSIFTCAGIAWLIVYVSRKYSSIASICAVLILLFFSALMTSRSRDWRDGYTFWRVSVRQVPSLPEARNLMGIFAAKKGRLSFARREYQAALRLDPGFSQARMNLSQLYLQTGDPGQAEKLLLEVIEEIPGLSSAHFNLAVVYKSRGKQDKAVAALEKACELEPKNLSAHYMLGEILMHRKESLPEAEEHLLKALDLDPDFLPALISLAELAASEGEMKKALAWIKHGLKIDPGNQPLLALRAKLLQE